MAPIEDAREGVESVTNRVVDTWRRLPPAARLALRSSVPTLAALVPALDALARSVEALDAAQRAHDEAVRREAVLVAVGA